MKDVNSRIIGMLKEWKSRREVCTKLGISNNVAVVHLRKMKQEGSVESTMDRRPWAAAFVQVYRIITPKGKMSFTKSKN